MCWRVLLVSQSSTWWVFHPKLFTFIRRHRQQWESLGLLGDILYHSRITQVLVVDQPLEIHLLPMMLLS